MSEPKSMSIEDWDDFFDKEDGIVREKVEWHCSYYECGNVVEESGMLCESCKKEFPNA